MSFTYQYLICGILLFFFYYYRKFDVKYFNDLKAIKPFVWLMLLGAVYEVVFTLGFQIKTAYWLTLYTLLEFFGFNYMFYRLLGKYRVMYLILNTVYILFFITSLWFWNLTNHSYIDAYNCSLEVVFIFMWAILWFKDLFNSNNLPSLWQMPSFYFVLGTVTYLCGGIIPILFTHHLFKATGLWTKYWLVFLVLGTFMRIMMIIGVLKSTAKNP